MSLAKQNYKFKKNLLMLCFDYNEATDHLMWSIAIDAIEGFCAGIGLENQYFLLATKVICSPFLIKFRSKNNMEIESKRGCLMGLPGTKMILHLLNRLVLKYTIKKTLGPEEFGKVPVRLVGDDGLAIFRKSTALKFIQNSKEFSLDIGRRKVGLYKNAANFCERFWIRGTFPMKPDTDENFLVSSLIDDINPRLYSREVKERNFQNQFDTNPCFGKFKAVNKNQSWSKDLDPRGNKRVAFMFIYNFRYLLPKNIMISMPICYGGMGLGSWALCEQLMPPD